MQLKTTVVTGLEEYPPITPVSSPQENTNRSYSINHLHSPKNPPASLQPHLSNRNGTRHFNHTEISHSYEIKSVWRVFVVRAL